MPSGDADLVVLATPVGTYAGLGSDALAPHLKPGATCPRCRLGQRRGDRDVLASSCPTGVGFRARSIPIAGTEQSGPERAFPLVRRVAGAS